MSDTEKVRASLGSIDMASVVAEVREWLSDGSRWTAMRVLLKRARYDLAVKGTPTALAAHHGNLKVLVSHMLEIADGAIEEGNE